MALTDKAIWTLIHGIGLGALFLLSFSGGLAYLDSLRIRQSTPRGIVQHVHRLQIAIPLMAVIVWLTVIIGTWVIYPWYQAKSGEGTGGTLNSSPQAYLQANE